MRAMTDRQQITPYPLRMPDDLREKLEASAKEHKRSLNAEIITILQTHFGDLEHFQNLANVPSGSPETDAFIQDITTSFRATVKELLMRHGADAFKLLEKPDQKKQKP
jgi:plasmid stability protein